MKKEDCFYGIYPVRVVHGERADPELIYKKHSFSYCDIEDLFYECWRATPDYRVANLSSPRTAHGDFTSWMKKNGERVKSYLNFLIDCK